MRREGLEPSRISYPQDFKSCAFASFAIPAKFYYSFNGRVLPLFYYSLSGRVLPLFYYSLNGGVSPLTEGEGFEPSRVLSPNDLANRPLHRLSNLPCARRLDGRDWSDAYEQKHLPIWANKSEGV